MRAEGRYALEDADPSRTLDADSHFLLIAAWNLALSLEVFDGDRRLPEGITKRQIGLIRHALEHWDEPGQGAYKGLAALNADPRSNRWRVDGSGVVGDIADDQALLEWAAGVRDALLSWDAT